MAETYGICSILLHVHRQTDQYDGMRSVSSSCLLGLQQGEPQVHEVSWFISSEAYTAL